MAVAPRKQGQMPNENEVVEDTTAAVLMVEL